MSRTLIGLLCLIALGWFAVFTLHWPFMGDATYIHYAVFLTRHGMAPYRDIIELNMPCAYLVERGVMALYGESALAWRLFDLTLLAISFVSCIAILRPRNWAAGVFAAALFATVHAQDGVAMAGERDLQVAVFQIAALACLLCGLRTEPSKTHRWKQLWPWFFTFGMLASLAVCIKPPAVLFLIASIGWTAFCWKPRQGLRWSLALSASAGAIIPVIASVLYLSSYHALFDFWNALHGLIAYHAQLERKPLSFLLSHSFSPVLVLFVLFVILLVLQRGKAGLERSTDALLAVSAVAGWLTYAIQGKGFSYQRYPFLIFLFPLIASAVFAAIQSTAAIRWLGWASIGAGTVLVLLFAHRAATFSQANPYEQMSTDLQTFGGKTLSGSVQCMDTAGGCIASLYENRLVQSTGFIYDCYLIDGQNPVVQQLRRRFESEIIANPPRIFIVTDSVCYGGKRSFGKYADWPHFTNLLTDHYLLARERTFTTPIRYWTRGDIPYDYRVYVRK